MQDKAYLILADGTVFEGKPFGASREATGELVFNTGMTGYAENLTDPNYFGQIVIQTFPHIGSCGIAADDYQSDKPLLSGYIVRDYCDEPSNFRAEGKLEDFMKEHDIPGIYGIDTRALTRIIRKKGSMNAKISFSSELGKEEYEALSSFSAKDGLEVSGRKETASVKAEGEAKYRVAVVDFGIKKSILNQLTANGCDVTLLPCSVSFDEIKALNPDGVLLPNGPSDPHDYPEITALVKKLFDSKIPMFGIGLGHEFMALAMGAEVRKLSCGHHGGNQPVKEIASDHILITEQNHNYAVVAAELPENVKESYINVNDGTCAGLDYIGYPAFSVQFHPNSASDPEGAAALFERFFAMLRK